MRTSAKMLLCCAVLGCALGMQAQDEDKPKDAEGCKDSPLITRFPGSIISSCDTKEYEQADLPMADGNAKHVEGEYHTWNYGTREGTSEIQVFRNFQTAIRNAGFTIDYTMSPQSIVGHKGSTWIYIENRGDYYDQTIVTEKQLKQEVTADASSLSNELNQSGHVAVYGIQFASNSAVIEAGSEENLAQIAKLLEQSPELKLRVEGHTDNQGSAAANMALSKERAQAVVAWLTAHGVDASRLSAKGMGQTKPVAENSSDDGRAKNRRVELVKE